MILYCCRRPVITGSPMRDGKNPYIPIFKYGCALTRNAADKSDLTMWCFFHFHYSFARWHGIRGRVSVCLCADGAHSFMQWIMQTVHLAQHSDLHNHPLWRNNRSPGRNARNAPLANPKTHAWKDFPFMLSIIRTQSKANRQNSFRSWTAFDGITSIQFISKWIYLLKSFSLCGLAYFYGTLQTVLINKTVLGIQ